VLGVALVAAAVNAGAAVALGDPTHPDHDGDAQPAGAPMHDHGTSDLNVRAARLHLLADVATSLTVAAAGAVLLADPGIPRLDPAVSILVALVVSWRAFGLLREANDVLLESSPAGLDLTALCTAIAADADVVDVHDLHVWSLSSQVRALSAHLVLHGHPTLEEAQHVRDRVKQAIAEPFAIAHATLELECEEACQPDPVTACALGNDSAQSAQLAEPAEPAEPAGSAESVRSARSAESVR
jgi:cobalt-zinc-cadmium efflux system protein